MKLIFGITLREKICRLCNYRGSTSLCTIDYQYTFQDRAKRCSHFTPIKAWWSLYDLKDGEKL